MLNNAQPLRPVLGRRSHRSRVETLPHKRISSPPSRWESVFVICVLLMAMGAFLNLGTSGLAEPSDASSGTLPLQIAWGIVSLLSIYLLLQCRQWLRILWGERRILTVSLLVAASVLWSDATAISMRRAVVFAATISFALYYALRFSLRDQLRLLAWSLGIAALASVPFAIFGIGTPTEFFRDAWNGVFLHKNALGHYMALSFLVFVIAGREEAIRKPLCFGGSALSLCLVLLSRSATSLVLLVFTIMLLTIARTPLVRHPYKLAACLLLIFTFAWSVFFGLEEYSGVLEALGKDSSLTGRTEVWAASWEAAMSRPMLGYGYSAFWLGENGPSRYVWKELHWEVPHAHNGYIDLALQLGLLGLVTFGIVVVLQFRDSLYLMRTHASPAATWPFAFLWFFLLSNITESDLLRPHTLSLILYVSAMIMAWRVRHNRRNDDPLVHRPFIHTAEPAGA